MSEQAVAPGSPLADVDIFGIMRMIPHRYPFLLIDRVVEITAFQRAVGIKNVTINEPFFPGHFPADPIMPGVLVVEAMAQAAAVLVAASLGPEAEGSGVYFMGIDNARFRRPVRPGDQLRLEVEALRAKLGVWKFAGKAVSDGKAVAEAEFSAKLMRS
ncbi:3-hydroxyacyl-ACP dehydratase FabZ [Benzoatithermus flavus]|uniref:3-hydroxyacyl-[acyl-carrier-protein] dehydratase FabZ n=1 Tax=Benzoatithermus flavus TaxID=3108223 RepID=A0ABU8XME1_9PROT